MIGNRFGCVVLPQQAVIFIAYVTATNDLLDLL
jgi:hypothetical protein